MEISIALVQFSISPSQPLINLARMESFIKTAAGQGARLVVFPEDAVTGPLAGQMEFAGYAATYLAKFQGLAVKYGVDVVPGTWVVQEGSAFYNTAHYINSDGTVAGSYRKINLWETEKATITPGAAVAVFPTAHGRVGLTICWDISFPLLFSEMKRQGAELVVSPTYWSFSRPAPEIADVVNDEVLLIDSLCVSRAFENDIVFAYCNAAGELQAEGLDAVLSGRSQVTHPTEKVLCKSLANAEEVLYCRATLHATP